MKKNCIILILISILISCEKSINITPPTILVDNISPSALEEIKIRVEEYAEIDGERVNADYFDWSVETSDGNVIKDDFNDSTIIFWTPEEAGYYIIKVKIGYDNNKSITAIKEILINESPTSLHYKIAGNWTGHAVRVWGPEWDLDISFDSSGYCSGEVTNDYGFIGGINSIFYSGGIWCWHKDGYGIACDENSNYPDYPCQRILIEGVNDNAGYGKVWVGYGDVYGDDPIVYNCNSTNYYLHRLTIDSETGELFFRLKNYGSGAEEIDYTLERK